MITNLTLPIVSPRNSGLKHPNLPDERPVRQTQSTECIKLRFSGHDQENNYVFRTEDEATLRKERQRLGEICRMANPTSLQVLTEQAGLGSGKKVLDIGCGSGHMTMDMGKAVRDDGWVIGVDLDEPMLQLNRQELNPPDHVTFQQGDILAPDFTLARREPVDITYSRFLLGHLPNPLEALRRMASFCKPGGYVVAENIDKSKGAVLGASPEDTQAFKDYLEIKRRLVNKGGRNINIGQQLGRLMERAGLVNIGEKEVHLTSIDPSDPGKSLPLKNFQALRQKMIDQGLLDEFHADRIEASLTRIAESKDTQVRRTVRQAWGQVEK